jgi:hypothetical protein
MGVALSSTPAARGQNLFVQLVGALEIAEVSRGVRTFFFVPFAR